MKADKDSAGRRSAQAIVPQNVWSIATSVQLQTALDAPECPPPLAQALQGLPWQTRNETTFERILAAPYLAPQIVAALLVCGATLHFETEGESADVPLEVALGKGQDRHAHRLSVPPVLHWGEAHVARAPADEPIVAAWAMVRPKGKQVSRARIALTGVWPEQVRLAQAASTLVGNPLNEEHITIVANLVQQEVVPPDNYLGSADYRRHLAGVLVRRALQACLRAWEGDDD